MFLRAIARPLLASWFIYGGIESLLEPERRAQRAEPALKPILVEAGLEDIKVTDMVKLHGGASIAAASALALSRSPKTAGLALAGLAAVTVVAGRPFWREENEQVRAEQRERFVMNVSLFGATLLAATAGHGKHHHSKAKAKKARASKAKAHKLEAKAAGKNRSLTVKRGK